jgi:hypothetical protein
MTAEHLTGPEIRETAAGEFLQGLLCGLACYADSLTYAIPPPPPPPPPTHSLSDPQGADPLPPSSNNVTAGRNHLNK